mmetsp:Transcript_15028/g.30721  ORF Transcript_15028/g.30721 Transcript_15028/m.30721 type:complete len:82 (+) Transcript_15028:429-674(+)
MRVHHRDIIITRATLKSITKKSSGSFRSSKNRKDSKNMMMIVWMYECMYGGYTDAHRCSEYTGKNPTALLGLFLVRATRKG